MFNRISINLALWLLIATYAHAGFGGFLNNALGEVDKAINEKIQTSENATKNTNDKVDPIELLKKHGFNNVQEFEDFKYSIPEFPNDSIEPFLDENFVAKVTSIYDETKNLAPSSYLKNNEDQKSAANSLFSYESLAGAFLRDRERAIEFHLSVQKDKEAEIARNEAEHRQEVAKYEEKKDAKEKAAKIKAQESAKQEAEYQDELKLERIAREKNVKALTSKWEQKGFKKDVLQKKLSMFDEKSPKDCYLVEFLDGLNGEIKIKQGANDLKIIQKFTDEYTKKGHEIIWGFEPKKDDRLLLFRVVQDHKDLNMRGIAESYSTILGELGLVNKSID